MFGRQRLEGILVNAVVLDKNVIPQFEIAGAFPVNPAFVRLAAQVIEFLAAVHVDLRAGPARTGFGHLPEIFFAPKEQDVVRMHARLLLPDISGFVISGDIALVILEAGGIQPVLRQAPDIRQELPGPGDGFLLVIIAEGPVAEHLEESMVAVVPADLIQVVMFSRHAQHFLRVDRTRIRALVRAKEDILELDHTGVGKKQGGIPARNKRSGWDEGMAYVQRKNR